MFFLKGTHNPVIIPLEKKNKNRQSLLCLGYKANKAAYPVGAPSIPINQLLDGGQAFYHCQSESYETISVGPIFDLQK
jgi:hypothetical protein